MNQINQTAQPIGALSMEHPEMNMTKTKRIALLGLTLACSTALANGTYTPTPPAPAPSTSSSESSSESNSESSANAGAVGIGYGGAGGSAQGGDSYSASQSGDVTNQTRSTYVNFPQPVWTTVPTPYGCIVSESKAGSFGWNLVSGSGSKQYSDAVCTAVRMAEAAMLHCQFATAAHLNKAAFEQMYKGQSGEFFLTGEPKNLDPVYCDELRRPVLRMSPAISTPTVTAASNVNVACPAPVTTSKPALRVPAKRPACVNCCK